MDDLFVAYYGTENLLPTKRDIVITDSSGPDKYSFHVLVLPYFVEDNEEAREFTARVLERLAPSVRAFIDPNVNKKTQNFRLTGSAKLGTNRYKRVTSDFGTADDISLQDLFITAPSGGRILTRIYTEKNTSTEQSQHPNIHDSVVQNAIELATEKGITIGHRFNEVRGTLLCFMRDEPSYCRICEEVHHHDNSLMISIEPIENNNWSATATTSYRVLEHCRQVRGKRLLIGEISGTECVIKPYTLTTKIHSLGLQEQIASRIKSIHDGKINPHNALSSAFELIPDNRKTIYSEPMMRPYELTSTLAVLAQMKLGKTKALHSYLEEYFPINGLETKVVRFVTFRQTFSNSISKNFPDFILYSDVTGDLDHIKYPRLIVQVESLHRLSFCKGALPEPIDLLVLDEAESILAQFNSGLHKHFNAAFAVFQWMLQTAQHVICMDANLSDRTYCTLERMRPSYPVHFHWNRFERAADDIYYFTADQGSWFDQLYKSLHKNLRIVIPTNSLTEARAYEESIRREFPKKKIMLYSSETAPSEKARHFSDVHNYWGNLDVLIFTPTCSAGVSFELEHFDILFGYFCDIS